MSAPAAQAGRLGRTGGRASGPRRRSSAGTGAPQGAASARSGAFDRLLGIALAGAVLALGLATCAFAA